jgi:hypothetical protein
VSEAGGRKLGPSRRSDHHANLHFLYLTIAESVTL